MTFTMLPIGRSVFRPRLHKTWPVAALAKAAPVTWMPAGPPTTAGAACLAETDSPAGAACVPAGAPGIEAAPVTELAWPAGWTWRATRVGVPPAWAVRTAAPATSRAIMTARRTRTACQGESICTFTSLNSKSAASLPLLSEAIACRSAASTPRHSGSATSNTSACWAGLSMAAGSVRRQRAAPSKRFRSHQDRPRNSNNSSANGGLNAQRRSSATG